LCHAGAVLAVAAFMSVAPVAAFAAGTAGTISTFAGDPIGSGPAVETAQAPAAIAVAPNSASLPGGTSLYVADSSVNVVREIGPTGQETVVAGNGVAGLSGEGGPATSAELQEPDAVAVDPSGDLLIGEFGYVKLVAGESCASDCPYGLHTMTQGSIYPIAGDGTYGAQTGDAGDAATTVAVTPVALTSDAAGDVLISEGFQVQLVAATDCSSDCPYGLAAMTAGDIYPVAGSGTAGKSGAGGPATAADLMQLGGIALDGAGDLLIADSGANEVQLVATSDCSSSCPYGLPETIAGHIYTVAGDGTAGKTGDGGPATAAELDEPEAVTVNANGELMIADTLNARVQLVTSTGVISTIAASGGSVADGEPATAGGLDRPNALAFDGAGDLLIGDPGNDRVRLVALQDCLSECAFGQSGLSKGAIYTIAGDGATLFSGDGGPATEAELHGPEDVAVDADGDVGISDSENNRIRWIAAQDCSGACPFGLASTTAGAIYTIAGGGGSSFPDNAVAATSVALGNPSGVLFDSAGDVLISDTDNGLIQVVAARSCSDACPYGLSAMTVGDIYQLAGNSGSGYSGDGGPATKAELYFPEGVALDGEGDVLIADDGNDRIRLIASSNCSSDCPYGLSTMTEGDIYTIAGGGSEGNSATGYPATAAALDSPTGIALDASGNLIVGDEGDDLVRVIAAQSCSASCPYGLGSTTKGDIYTIAGNGEPPGSFVGDGGPATSAGLFYPTWVTVDSAGDVLVTDSGHWRLRLLAATNCASSCVDGLPSTTAGDIYTIAGDGSPGFSGDGGPAVDAALGWSAGGGLAVDGAGNVLIADSGNDRIRRIGSSVEPAAARLSPSPVTFGDEVAGETSPTQQVTVTNYGGSPLTISAVALTGTDAGAYKVTDDGCSGKSVGAGATCTVNVAFAPTSVGADSASLSVTDNATGSPQSVTLTGTAVAPTPTVTPATLSFGDGASAAQTVTVTNPGPSALSIGAPALSGTKDTAFLIGPDTCASANLPSEDSCTISLTTTAASGKSTATLQIPDDAADGVASVALEALPPPAFTTASPPLAVAAGSALDYTFTAEPASTYALAPGAPQWLKMDSSSGALTGTVPAGTTSFSYAVTATDVAGSVTAGPFFVGTTSPVTVTGTVTDTLGNGVSGVVVDACLSSGGLCFTATTTSSGAFTVDALPDTSMVLTAYPPAPRASSATDPISIPSTGLSGESLTVSDTVALEDLDLVPSTADTETAVLDTFEPTPASVTGCANGFATVTTLGRSEIDYAFTADVAVLGQTSPGTYAGDLPPAFPIHGPAELTSAVDCPPPASALAPSEGPASGGTTVTLTGSGFTGTTAVDFGDAPASSFTVLSDDAIQAVAPAGTGTVAVSVFGAGAPSGGTVVDQYTYQAVESIAPSSGPPAGGTWVIVNGVGLSSAQEVMFGQTASPSFEVLSDTELEALSPPGTGTQDITVQTQFGGTTPASPADRFTYGSGADAGIAKHSASDARRGATGDPPAAGSAVSGAPVTAAMTRSIASAIERRLRSQPLEFRLGTTTAAAKTAAVRPDGIPPGGSLASIALQFVYQYAPQIYSKVNMIEDIADQEIARAYPTCETNLNALVAAIDLALTPTVDALVDALLPEVLAAETASLFESGPALLALYAVTPLALNYVVNKIVGTLIAAAVKAALPECKKPQPPPHGGGGGGGGFSPNAYIDPGGNVLDSNGNPIGGATVTILRSSAWAGPFTALDPSDPGILPAINPETTGPEGSFDWDVYAGYYEIQASATNCTSAANPAEDTATIGPYPVPPPQLGLVVNMACANEAPAAQPAVNSISATGGAAAGGTPVTILGTGFTPASTVTFAAAPASAVTYESPQTLTVVSPAGSGMANVVVRSAGGSSQTSPADEFYYGSPPTVTGLDVTQGPSTGGTVVTVHGTGFTGASVVGFGGIPGSELHVKSDTELQVTTPAEQPGTVDVVVDTPAGGSTVSSADRFTFLATNTNPGGPGPVSTNPVTNPVTTNPSISTIATFNNAPALPSCTLEPLSNTVQLAKHKPEKRHKSKVSVGTLSLTATCSQAVSIGLTGVLTELVGKKPKHGKQKTRRFDLGPVSGTLAAGVGKTLVLKLPSSAISGLESKDNESVALTIIATNANGQGRATASITRLKNMP
jgi:hypothetical protein